VIGIVWVNHHAVFGRFTRIDRVAMFVNLVLLMFVTAIPFSTATLATYLRDGGVDQHLAAAVYGIPVLGVAVSFTVLCGWAMRRGLLRDRTRASASVMRFARGAVAISAAIGIAFVSAVAALAAHATIAAYYTFERAPADEDG
jgi:uncharacterized membrane protein